MFLSGLRRKPSKIWVNQDSEFYKKWLDDNHIEICSTHNEGNSVVAKRFIKTLKHKPYRHMTDVSVYFYVLDNIVDTWNNTYHKKTQNKAYWY